MLFLIAFDSVVDWERVVDRVPANDAELHKVDLYHHHPRPGCTSDAGTYCYEASLFSFETFANGGQLQNIQ